MRNETEFDDVQVYSVDNPPAVRDEQETQVTVVNAEGIDRITQFEIDTQIATAHRFPRSITKFSRELKDMVTADRAVAASCFYVLPRDGKNIEGPSVRISEMAVSAWGNCRVGSRIIEEAGDYIVAQGVAHDLERNVYYSTEVRRRITNKYGKKYSADMIAVTANAACSIAARNASFKMIPRSYIDGAYKLAKQTAIGDAKTLSARREDALRAFNKMGVSKEQVFDMLGVAGLDDVTTEHIGTLIGTYNAIKEGEVSIEEVFPTPDKSDVKLKGSAEATKVSPKESSAENTPATQGQSTKNSEPEPEKEQESDKQEEPEDLFSKKEEKPEPSKGRGRPRKDDVPFI